MLAVVDKKNVRETLITAISARWHDYERVNNHYYKDAKYHIIPFCEWSSASIENAEQFSLEVQRYMEYLRFKGKSPVTIDNFRRAISSHTTWCIANGFLQFTLNPCSKKLLRMPRVTIRIKAPVSDEEWRAIKLRASISPILPALLLCLSGMRPIGASRVSISDIDLDSRTVRVIEKSVERFLPLKQEFCDMLKAWFDAGWKLGQTLPHYSGPNRRRKLKPVHHVKLHECTLMHWLQRIRKEAGLPPHVTMGALRRRFLFKCLQNDVSPAKAAAIAGNSITTIQKHYVRLANLNCHKVVDSLDL